MPFNLPFLLWLQGDSPGPVQKNLHNPIVQVSVSYTTLSLVLAVPSFPGTLDIPTPGEQLEN